MYIPLIPFILPLIFVNSTQRLWCIYFGFAITLNYSGKTFVFENIDKHFSLLRKMFC